MMISRKKTGKVVGVDVPVGSLATYLSVLPDGVYSVETDSGAEIAEAAVKHRKVRMYRLGQRVTVASVEAL